MSYYPIKQALEKGDLELAKRLARITANPALELALALKDAKVQVTFDSPDNPDARWGQVIGHSQFSIRVAHIGKGGPFEVSGIRTTLVQSKAQKGQV